MNKEELKLVIMTGVVNRITDFDTLIDVQDSKYGITFTVKSQQHNFWRFFYPKDENGNLEDCEPLINILKV